jgi:hypothetical protein
MRAGSGADLLFVFCPQAWHKAGLASAMGFGTMAPHIPAIASQNGSLE